LTPGNSRLSKKIWVFRNHIIFSQPRRQAGLSFGEEPTTYNKVSSSETESTTSDMSDLSYEKELGEVGEGGEGGEVDALQHCRKLTTSSA
jgi:hypothetical protein